MVFDCSSPWSPKTRSKGRATQILRGSAACATADWRLNRPIFKCNAIGSVQKLDNDEAYVTRY